MSMRSVCDARITDLVTHVSALSDAKLHRYASWSLEKFIADPGEIHLAVWPEPAPQKVAPFTTGSGVQDYVVTQYGCAIWEDASDEVSRAVDDDEANGIWLDLAEEVEARFRVQANLAMGEDGSLTRLQGVSWGFEGTSRWMVIAFTNEQPVSFT